MNPDTKAFGAMMLGVSLVLLSVTAFTVQNSDDLADSGILSTFSDKEELEEFLTREGPLQDGGRYSPTPLWEGYSMDDTSSEVPHSQTNVQVVGVDEGDFVKTDGEYVFVSSGREVCILKAYPAEDMMEVSSISASDLAGDTEAATARLSALFVSGDRLVVIAGVYALCVDDDVDGAVDNTRTMIGIFDISDPTQPELELSVGVSGFVLTCRMVEDTVYAITQLHTRNVDDEITIPFTYSVNEHSEVGLSTIRYDPETPLATDYVNVLAVELTSGDHSSLSLLAGWASTIYMSNDSLYMTIQKQTGSVTAATSIYRVDLAGTQMFPSARGDGNGSLLNQFSMDEHESYLRVATTTDWANPMNAVYVLNDTLSVVGALEGLAPNERIYSARFVEDTLYLVTFRQIDPLFVIDLSVPTMPAVVGMLEIPGFSTYLHPMDDTHVLGIGQEGWRVKISMFDVSDPDNPVEQSKYLIEDSYWSAALYDHKAVLYDSERELLVIPSNSQWDYESHGSASSAYVFHVNVSEGISLRGVVAHEFDADPGAGPIERALYIGEYLYTFSRSAVQANMLEDLAFVELVRFADDSYNGYYGN